MTHMLGDYRRVRWELPMDFLEKSHYLRVVNTLHWQSSPGYPYCLDVPTNGDLFRVVDGKPSPVATDRVWVLVQRRLLEKEADPIRLFIKPEPHKLKKLNVGAYRLISSVSVIDQIIDHMLFDEMNHRMIQNYMMIPPKVGWTPYKGGWKVVPMNWLSLDKSAWDWSMEAWICELILRVREESSLSKDHPKWEDWKRLAKWRYSLLYGCPEFVTSLGMYLKQKLPGVQKSGCVNTISDNSMAQDILHIRACLESSQRVTEQWTMGDDTYLEPVSNLDDYVEKLGQYCHLKPAARSGEFAGFRFVADRVEPMYKGKHAFNLLHFDSANREMLDSYQLMYHRSLDRSGMKNAINQLKEQEVDENWLDGIWDGEA